MIKISYSIDEVTKATGLGRTSVYEEIRENRLRSFKVGKRRLVAEDDLKAWIDSHRGISDA